MKPLGAPEKVSATYGGMQESSPNLLPKGRFSSAQRMDNSDFDTDDVEKVQPLPS